MPPINATILVDTNVIIEAHRCQCWADLSNRFRIETVEECVIETQTGHQNRRTEEHIDETVLRAQLAAVHVVPQVDIARISLLEGPELDPGEKELWAHATSRSDVWLLCGPDMASMRFGFEQGHRERLVSLGGLLAEMNFRAPTPIKQHYEREWLESKMTNLALGIL